MKTKYCLILLVILSGCAYDDLTEADLMKIRGNWTGAGQFDDPVVNKEFGLVKLNIAVHGPGNVEGNFGDGRFSVAEGGKRDDVILIQVVLDDRIDKDMYCQKDHVVFLFNKISAQKIEGAFYLKSNFSFDLGMRPGKFILDRKD